MTEHTDLAGLPEAVPLRRVAPGWRVLALLTLLMSGGLLLVIVVLALALMNESDTSGSPASYYGGPPTASYTVTQNGSPDGPLPAIAESPTVLDPDLGGQVLDPRLVPYPIKADLAAADQSGEGADTAARRFLRLGEDVWRPQRGHEPEHVTVSQDGRFLAAVSRGRLLGGTVASGPTLDISLEEGMSQGFTGEPGEGSAGPPAGASPPPPPGLYDPAMLVARPVVGEPAWRKGSPVLYFAVAGGRVRCCRFEDGPRGPSTTLLAVSADQATPVPGTVEQLVLLRSRAVPKLDGPGTLPAADPTEVVLRDLATGTERVIVTAGSASWRHVAVSPDGARLALVSNLGNEGATDARWRVFLVPLAGGDPKPVTPPAESLGPVCWTPDGAGLVYARFHEAATTDRVEEEPAAHLPRSDLFHLDLTSGRETRLSRGGGFFAPSLDDAGLLYYLTTRAPGSGPVPILRRVPLAAALGFAAKEPESPPRTAAAWAKLVATVLTETDVSASADGKAVTPEELGKWATRFARHYQEAFAHKPPASLEDFDRLRRELARLSLPSGTQERLRLVFGAALGDLLCRQHGARWQLVPGPLARAEAVMAPPPEASPFAHVVNPFAPFSAVASPLRKHMLTLADGRVLVLTNDTDGTELLRDLVDPDLARGAELLRQGKLEEGERILRDLLQKAPQRENGALALHIGHMLYNSQRYAAVVDLMKRWSYRRSPDPRKYNLLGLAQLQANPQQAADAFKSALRCDLHYGPAYLNLALAYEKLNQRPAAAQCLQRYLQLLPMGALAADARRRLGELTHSAPALAP